MASETPSPEEPQVLQVRRVRLTPSGLETPSGQTDPPEPPEAAPPTPDLGPSAAPTEPHEPTEPVEPIPHDEADFEEKFNAARDRYAKERARLRTKAAGLTGDHLSKELETAKNEYQVMLQRSLVDRMGHRLDTGEDTEDIRLEAAEFFFLKQKELDQREADILTGEQPKLKQAWEKFKGSKKLRRGIGLSLAAVTIGVGIATGPGAALVGLGAVRLAWRGITGDVIGSEIHAGRKAKRTSKGIAKGAEGLDLNDEGQRNAFAARMGSREQTKHLDHLSDEERQKVEAKQSEVRDRSVLDLAEKLKASLGERSEVDLVAAVDVIRDALRDHLKLQHEQIQADRKSVRASRLSGLAGAAVFMGVGPLVHVFEHMAGGSGGHVDKAHTSGKTPPEAAQPAAGGTVAPAAEAAHESHQFVLHDPNHFDPNAVNGAEHYGEHGVAVAEMQPGETPHKMAAHILSKFEGWDKFSEHAKELKIKHLAQQIAFQEHTEPGSKIRWTYEQAAGSYHFNGVEHAEHLTHTSPRGIPGSDLHNGGTGGVSAEHAGNNIPGGGGGSGPEDMSQSPFGRTPFETATGPDGLTYHYNLSGFAESRVRPGMNPNKLAEQILQRFDGWNNFTGSQQSLKIGHLANELAVQNFRPGSTVRWSYDLARGSFNYVR